jgi:hypothetical protein
MTKVETDIMVCQDLSRLFEEMRENEPDFKMKYFV